MHCRNRMALMFCGCRPFFYVKGGEKPTFLSWNVFFYATKVEFNRTARLMVSGCCSLWALVTATTFKKQYFFILVEPLLCSLTLAQNSIHYCHKRHLVKSNSHCLQKFTSTELDFPISSVLKAQNIIPVSISADQLLLCRHFLLQDGEPCDAQGMACIGRNVEILINLPKNLAKCSCLPQCAELNFYSHTKKVLNR